MIYWLSLAKLDSLSDPKIINGLKTQLFNSSSPILSVETILHTIFPFNYVCHTHSDAVEVLHEIRNT